VDSIWARIAPGNIKAAEELVNRFAAVFEMLVQNPQAGRARPDLGPNLRSFAVGHYVIFYLRNPMASPSFASCMAVAKSAPPT